MDDNAVFGVLGLVLGVSVLGMLGAVKALREEKRYKSELAQRIKHEQDEILRLRAQEGIKRAANEQSKSVNTATRPAGRPAEV